MVDLKRDHFRFPVAGLDDQKGIHVWMSCA